MLVTTALLMGCNNSDLRNKNRVFSGEGDIWLDYQVRGGEKDSLVTILLQFRDVDENGPSLRLQEPCSVTLDGEKVREDSSLYTGIYYEIQKPADSFTGKHTIVFTDFNKKQYRETFEYRPVRLVNEIPDTLRRDAIDIKLEGLKSEDYVRVILTDTAFTSNGINRVDTVRYGRMSISRYDLKEVVDGPIQLELVREYENPLKNSPRAGGRMTMFYTLRREFLLQN